VPGHGYTDTRPISLADKIHQSIRQQRRNRFRPYAILMGLVQPAIFFIRKLMPTVRLKENEPFEVAMRRFKRTIEKTGLLTELRAREFYEKPTAERKRKHAAAIKRHYKRIRSQQLPPRMY